MTLNEFQRWCEVERGERIDDRLTYDIVGLCGEAGELASEWKKNARGAYTRADFSESVLLELGDILHYLVRTASDLGYTAEEVIQGNVEKLTNRKKYGKGNYGKRS